ncbi:unnamed protein product [Callosobruchus maculatus]|uniref:Uncharacterized protein n=1 Tax=Callosobruchus maculatus TaxID=64391 RepID=A0A653DYX4_CALMS|nr:unnamed protein product [Callosobruchus maculatus]
MLVITSVHIFLLTATLNKRKVVIFPSIVNIPQPRCSSEPLTSSTLYFTLQNKFDKLVYLITITCPNVCPSPGFHSIEDRRDVRTYFHILILRCMLQRTFLKRLKTVLACFMRHQ